MNKFKPIFFGLLLSSLSAASWGQQPTSTYGSISGRVEPALNLLFIGLARYSYGDDGEIELTNYQQARASTELARLGEYRFEKVEPGEYYVYVNPSSLLISGAPKGEAFAMTYYPGVTDIRMALRVTIRPGESVVLRDFKLASFSAASPTFRLINATGDSERKRDCATITWKLRGAPSSPGNITSGVCGQENTLTRINKMGMWQSGFYDVFAGWPDPATGALEGALASFDLRNVDVEVEVVVSRARLTGRMVMEDRDGTLRAASGIQFELRPKTVGPTEWGQTIADGSLQHDRVGRNDYTVEFVNLPQDAYVARLIEGERDVLKDGLQVGSLNVHIDGLISLSGGTLEGTITNSKGAPAQRAIVALVPDSGPQSRHLYRNATTDEHGAFAIRGIAPGSYQLFAWSKLNGAAYKNADFMQAYITRGIPVAIERNGKAAIEAKLLDQ